ncbi:MAG: DNA primase [Clostridia bacterium]|nr:DNA primase [Clostridia bacterium]
MAIPSSVIQEITERTDIADLVSRYVNLKRSGNDFLGLCPFHSEKTPSFRVTPSKQMFYCFGCQKGGGAVQFLMQIENLTFVDAIKKLGAECGVAVSDDHAKDDKAEKRRKTILAANKEAARFFYSCLSKDIGLAARQYLKSRQLSPEIIKKFGIGFAPDTWDSLKKHLFSLGFSEELLVDAGLLSRTERGSTYDRFRNRVMFPILDITGSVIGFGGRVLDDSKPKYLNTADTPVFDKSANLYALNYAKNDKSGQVIVVEGYMDVVTLYQHGIERAVASLGTALTSRQARLLKRYAKEVVLCYDGDGAGVKAAHRAIGLLREADVKAKIITLVGAKDPDEYCKKFGVEQFLANIQEAKTPVLYKIAALKENYDVTQPEQQTEFLIEVADEIAQLKEPVERDVYTREIARTYMISEEALINQVKKAVLRLKQQGKQQEKMQVQRIVRQKAVSHDTLEQDAEGRLVALLLKYPNTLEVFIKNGGAEIVENEQLKEAVMCMIGFREAGERIPEPSVFVAMQSLETGGKVAGALQQLNESADPDQEILAVIKKIKRLKLEKEKRRLQQLGDIEALQNLLHNEED